MDNGEEVSFTSSSPSILIFVLIAVCVFILASGVVIGCTLYRIYCRRDPRTGASVPPVPVLLNSLDQGEQENPYQSLQQPASDVYQTISLERPRQDAKSDNTATGEDEVYENF